MSTVPFAPDCGKLAQLPPARSPGLLVTARERQRSPSAFTHPTPDLLYHLSRRWRLILLEIKGVLEVRRSLAG